MQNSDNIKLDSGKQVGRLNKDSFPAFETHINRR
jgi:hypothetical protein